MSVMYERIEALCYHNATTITAMCKELGISRSVLSELRSGRTKELSVHNLRKIADYFEIPIIFWQWNSPQRTNILHSYMQPQRS